MISYHYQKDSWRTFEEGRRLEWTITNGIGGYAGSSLIGAHSRTHQGYLIASLHAPTSRYVTLSKINETLQVSTGSGSDNIYSLETAQHLTTDGTVYAEGQKYLEEFIYDGSAHYRYQAGNISLQKHITLKQGENVCAVAYEIENNGADAVLTLVPLFDFREHSALCHREELQFSVQTEGQTLRLTPEAQKDHSVFFQISEGNYEENSAPYDLNEQLQIEVELETEGLNCHYCPVRIPIAISAGCRKKISVLCSVLPSGSSPSAIDAETAFSLVDARTAHIQNILQTAGYGEGVPLYVRNQSSVFPAPTDLPKALTLAADLFLCDRASTGLKTVLAGLPWFTDWGRDTMIAFTGLTLCTHRYQEAQEILLTFSRYIRNGIVPNMFPDDDTPPLYNTADASLWYFYAVWQYLRYVNTAEAYEFVRTEIYPHLQEIITAYRDGTDFCIYMDTDGLIHAGSGLDQITWMDVRVGEWVVTPRHGKPVEINALWYNALKIMEELTERFYGGNAAAPSGTLQASDYRILAEKCRASYCQKFWNPEKGCLYDVIEDDGTPDDSLRPNQIYAVSLPHSILSEEQERCVVAVVHRELYAGCGLRSLSRDHKDYHGIYCGSLPKRDAAYHQGTAWGFLLGGFITAFLKVHRHSPESIAEALSLLAPVEEHLTGSGCIGAISEIFDGDAPHNPRGCYAQAWSVGEVLRAYTEDILPHL
ncbi:MAG: 4-alpha-glucanotransferase [Roseburia sp.]|nr:4-alpha-glucanotransferase [Roseburia sp.]